MCTGNLFFPDRGWRRRVKRAQRGFSLMELLIVISIILIILLFAVPQYNKITIRGNETSAVKTLGTLHAAESLYAAQFPAQGYTCTLQNLGPPQPGQPVSPTAADDVDSKVAGGTKDGYVFTIQGCTTAANGQRVVTYQVVAVPETPGKSGIKAFCTDDGGSIRYDPSGNAAACLSGNNVL